jgi:CBS domain-containing protein
LNPSKTEFLETIASLLGNKGRSVWTAHPEMSVFEALALMSVREVGALPVVSGGRLVGLFSERDYARKVILKGRSSRDTVVSDIMTAPVISVTSQATVGECMHTMTAHHVRHLPVVEDEKLAGIISIGDLVNSIISAQEKTIRHLHDYISGAYPG